MKAKILIVILSLFGFLLTESPAAADHAWSSYHWARTTSSFNLNLVDNVTPSWDPYLVGASSDWSPSTVLDTTVVPKTAKGKNCGPTSGRVEVCNAKYGNNGWLGLAQVWVSGDHIVQGLVKVNDTYFSSAPYNSPAWKRMVMCQEVAHTFGLDHQDENHSNANLGSCMDYTGDPDGPPSNEHPNQHDFDQLESIYGHVDTVNTVSQSTNRSKAWGKKIGHGLYINDLGRGHRVYTFVTWEE